ncbi:MAG: MurR/RpiR family transcriptional regulator [Oscillospiraceae bacterium]|nr:MurR/RpiR family transcriptional regulator [Oscillospiraceae bacterium]
MSYGNVFTKINREYYQLTGAEKKIADYILSQRQDCQYMSISELAEVAEVAEATVSRFCRRLGYRGYSAFKLAVAGASAGQRPVNPLYGEILAEDNVGEMCRKICAADVDAITQTLAMIDPAAITAAADLLLGADQVLCMGLGGSMILATEAAHLFSTALPNFYAVEDSHHQAIRAAMLTSRDAVLYFSYSGSTRDMVELLKLARERGAGTVLITRFPKSPGAALADIVLSGAGWWPTPWRTSTCKGRKKVSFYKIRKKSFSLCVDKQSRELYNWL